MSPAARAAAIARAEADQKAEAQAAAAAKAEKAATVRKPSRHFNNAPAVEVRFGRTSPAAQARAFMAASQPAALLSGDADPGSDIALTSDEAKVVLQLEADRRALKDIKATDRKAVAKREMLPAYQGWIEGFMAAGNAERGPLDKDFTQLMAGTIDAGQYEAALSMLEHAVINGLEMPAHFNRDPLTFAIDQICEAAITLYDLATDTPPDFDAEILTMLQDLVKDHDVDLHDEVEAKLYKALGRAILSAAPADDVESRVSAQKQALSAYIAALGKHDRVGVKKDIDKLQRELKKSDPASQQQE